MTSPIKQIDRIVLIANPQSSGNGLAVAQELHQDITKRFPGVEVEVLETERAGHAEQLAKREAGPKALIVSVSGDGGYHEVVNGAVAGTSRAPLCVVHGAGNANDHHQSVQDGRGLVELLEHGRIKPMPLLEITMPEGDSRLAHSYIGFGVTARIARKLNQESHTAMSELGLALRTLLDHRPLKADLGNGVRRYDLLLAFNISQMAKYLKVEAAAPQADTFDFVRLPHRPWWYWPIRLLKAVSIGITPDRAAKRQSFRFPDAVEVQLDGEVIACAKGSKVVIRIVPGAIRTLVPSEDA